MTAVIFDLDGTLIESAPAIQSVANKLMGELDLTALTLDEVKNFIGAGSPIFLERAFASRSVTYDEATFERHVQRIMTLYSQEPEDANSAMPGADQALRTLLAQGMHLGMCTNKWASATQMVINAQGWDRVFSVVIAGDTLATRKPHPEPLLEAARQLVSQPVIYVGDSDIDAETAQAAGIPFVLFTEGYRHAAVEALPHAAAFSSFVELPALILDQFADTAAGKN